MSREFFRVLTYRVALSWLVGAQAWIFSSYAEEISGVVDHVEGSRLYFRTANENLILDLDQMGELERQLLAPEAKKRIKTYSFKSNQILERERVPFGVRNDCSELPLEIDDLLKLAEEGPDEMNIVDFLNQIPKGTLQTFTFVTNSQSLQKGEGEGRVTEDWPRVIRTSNDGRVTMSFVCNPNQDAYGQVEILYFDEKNKLQSASIDFNKPNVKAPNSSKKTTKFDLENFIQKLDSLSFFQNVHASPDSTSASGFRVERNPSSCLSCHGTSPKNGFSESELRFNWPEYHFWGDCETDRGITMYGMSDDNMGTYHRSRLNPLPDCDEKKDKSAHEFLRNKFMDFKKKAKTDPCFGTLPWEDLPEESEVRVGTEKAWTNEDYQYYPYAEVALRRVSDDPTAAIPGREILNYSLRTNTNITASFGRLTAKRNFQLLKDSPYYDRFKFYLAMEAIPGCLTEEQKGTIAKEIGIDLPEHTRHNHDPKKYSLLYSVGTQVIGMEKADWTMHPPPQLSVNPRTSEVKYNSAIASDDSIDHSIHDITLVEVARDIASEFPSVQDPLDNALSNGATKIYGNRFSCLDELGTGLIKNKATSSQEKRDALCKALKGAEASFRKVNEALFSSSNAVCLVHPNPPVDLPIDEVEIIVDETKRASIDRGRELVKRCVDCHDQGRLGFITDSPQGGDDPIVARLKGRAEAGGDAFWKLIDARLQGIEGTRMPIGCEVDNTCIDSESDRQAVIDYLKSLTEPDKVYVQEKPEKPNKSQGPSYLRKSSNDFFL